MGSRRLNNKLNIVGANLRKYRDMRKLSQPDLCRELALRGVTMYISDIYSIEHFSRTVKDFELYAICKVLNINLEQIYEGVDKEYE